MSFNGRSRQTTTPRSSSGRRTALFPIEKLAADGGGSADRPGGGIRFSVGVIAESPDDVNALIDHVQAAGGRVTKEPVAAEYFEGRSAYFADPEGNYWGGGMGSRRQPGSGCRQTRAGIAAASE